METNTYAQAKIEYTNQLIDLVKPIAFDNLFSLYQDSKSKSRTVSDTFQHFRNSLQEIPNWNQTHIKINKYIICHNLPKYEGLAWICCCWDCRRWTFMYSLYIACISSLGSPCTQARLSSKAILCIKFS